MSGTLSDLGVIAADPNFQARCLIALKTAAVNVIGEGDGVANHLARATYAANILNPINLILGLPIAQIVLTGSDIQQAADVTQPTNPSLGGYMIGDTAIQNNLNNNFNAIAGIVS